MQAYVPDLTEKQTIPNTEEPLMQLQLLEKFLNELPRGDRRANDSHESGRAAVQESDDLLVELSSVKETLKRETAISKGLRRTIEKLQEENKRLGKNAGHENVDGTDAGNYRKRELKDPAKIMTGESKTAQGDLLELREKVHELEKENESLQQKLKKKDKELERFQGEVMGEYSNI